MGVDTQVMNGNNIGMLQLAGDLGFLHEAQDRLAGIGGGAQALDCHKSMQVTVPRPYHLAHTASAEGLQIFVLLRCGHGMELAIVGM